MNKLENDLRFEGDLNLINLKQIEIVFCQWAWNDKIG